MVVKCESCVILNPVGGQGLSLDLDGKVYAIGNQQLGYTLYDTCGCITNVKINGSSSFPVSVIDGEEIIISIEGCGDVIRDVKCVPNALDSFSLSSSSSLSSQSSSFSSNSPGGCPCPNIAAYKVTVSGATNNFCTDCTTLNTDFCLLSIGDCVWGTNIGEKCSLSGSWTVVLIYDAFVDPPVRWLLEFNWNGTDVVVQYSIEASSWDCNGPNTLTKIQENNFCNWPNTVTIVAGC